MTVQDLRRSLLYNSTYISFLQSLWHDTEFELKGRIPKSSIISTLWHGLHSRPCWWLRLGCVSQSYLYLSLRASAPATLRVHSWYFLEVLRDYPVLTCCWAVLESLDWIQAWPLDFDGRRRKFASWRKYYMGTCTSKTPKFRSPFLTYFSASSRTFQLFVNEDKARICSPFIIQTDVHARY